MPLAADDPKLFSSVAYPIKFVSLQSNLNNLVYGYSINELALNVKKRHSLCYLLRSSSEKPSMISLPSEDTALMSSIALLEFPSFIMRTSSEVFQLPRSRLSSVLLPLLPANVIVLNLKKFSFTPWTALTVLLF